MYDFEPVYNSGNPFAEVFDPVSGETAFYCVDDATALYLACLLSGELTFAVNPEPIKENT